MGDGADPVAREGEDVEAGPAADAAAGGADVDPERQLTVGPRRHEVVPPAVAHGDAGEEAGHRVAAVVLERDRASAVRMATSSSMWPES